MSCNLFNFAISLYKIIFEQYILILYRLFFNLHPNLEDIYRIKHLP